MRFIVGALVVCIAAVLSPKTADADITYAQNTTAIVWNSMGDGAATSVFEFGDQVQLQGIGRELVNALMVVQVGGTGLGDYNFDVQTNIRALDGPAGGSQTFSPGTLLYSQTDSIVALPEGAGGTAAAYLLNLNFPEVVVPDEFAIMFNITRQGGNTGTVGFHWADAAATTGFSDNTYFWGETTAGSGVYTTYAFTGGINSNLRLQLTTVPEPTAAGALALGLIGISFRRRKR